MRVWSVDTGTPKGELDGSSFAFSKDNSSEYKVVKYSVSPSRRTCCVTHVISEIGRDSERIHSLGYSNPLTTRMVPQDRFFYFSKNLTITAVVGPV